MMEGDFSRLHTLAAPTAEFAGTACAVCARFIIRRSCPSQDGTVMGSEYYNGLTSPRKVRS